MGGGRLLQQKPPSHPAVQWPILHRSVPVVKVRKGIVMVFEGMDYRKVHWHPQETSQPSELKRFQQYIETQYEIQPSFSTWLESQGDPPQQTLHLTFVTI